MEGRCFGTGPEFWAGAPWVFGERSDLKRSSPGARSHVASLSGPRCEPRVALFSGGGRLVEQQPLGESPMAGKWVVKRPPGCFGLPFAICAA